MSLSKFLLFLLLNLTKMLHGSAKNENEPMAIFYENEDKSGGRVDYFEESNDYGHIQSVVDQRELSGLALICASGVFVLYNQEEFDSDSDDEIRILAGKETCIPPGSVKSFIFVQSYGSTMQDTLTVFNDQRFGGGMPFKINAETEHNAARLMQMGQINSFILMGNSKWTITTRYRTFCIQADGHGEYPVCPVPYANALFHMEEMYWLSARRGCDDLDSTILSLSYCFNHGSGNLEPISTGETTPPPLGETGGEGTENDTNVDGVVGRSGSTVLRKCENIDEFTLLLKIRLTHDFDSLYQIQFPLNKAHSWRTEILDYTIEIVNICIIDDLVDTKLLRYIREMYIYFAEKVVWAEGKGWPTKPRQRIYLVGHEITRCLTHMIDKEWANVAIKLSEEILKNMETPGIRDSDIDPEFMPINGYDLVMEFIWLSINYAGAACHAALEYETDFWMDYMNVAYDMYLRPMAEYWGKPGDILEYYPVLFGGFGVQRQHRGLAAAVTALYKAVSLDKLLRPIEVDANFQAG